MMDEFNLVDQPWIRVRDQMGDLQTVSLHDAFARAHAIRELAGDLPTQDFSVLRVLLAVLYRALDSQPAKDPFGAWAELWEQPELPLHPLDKYLEQWRDRFDLFNPKHPFMQVADLRTLNHEVKPLNLLVPDSEGLFPMRSSIDALRPAEAARWVVHCQAYDISGIKSGAVGDPRVKGGKGYPIGIGWAGWLGGITVIGDTLRETLLLNLVLKRESDGRDLPIWEEPPLTSAPREGVVVRGPIALMTWPQRRIRLFHDNGKVVAVLVCNGDPVPYTDLHHRELMSAWRLSGPQTKKLKRTVYMPWSFDPGTALWRGLRAVLPLIRPSSGEDAPFLTAGVLRWLGELEGNDVLETSWNLRVRVASVTYGSNNSAWDDIGADELSFNIRLVEEPAAQEGVLIALERAENATRILGDLAANLALAAGATRDDAYARGRDLAYSALDSAFRIWLRSFDPAGDLESALVHWTAQVRTICQELGLQFVKDAGPAAWLGRVVDLGRKREQVLMTTGLAESWFRASLRRQLPLPAQQLAKTTESEFE